MRRAPPAPSATPRKPDIQNWAFRSLCTATGCIATGTRLENMNVKIALDPAVTAVLRFTDGHWQQSPDPPDRFQVDHDLCLGVDGKLRPGSDTLIDAKTLEPQTDGTLRGV